MNISKNIILPMDYREISGEIFNYPVVMPSYRLIFKDTIEYVNILDGNFEEIEAKISTNNPPSFGNMDTTEIAECNLGTETRKIYVSTQFQAIRRNTIMESYSKYMSRQSIASQVPASKQIYQLLNHFENIVNHYAFSGGFEISGKITKPHQKFKGLIELDSQIKFDIEKTDKGDNLVQKIIDSVANFAKFPATKSYTLLVGSNVAKVLTTYANANNTASTMKTLREKLEEAFSIKFSHHLISKDEVEKFKDYLVLFPNDNTLIKFICGFSPSLFPRVHTHSALSGEQMVCLMSNAGFLAKDNIMLISKLKAE